MKKLVRYGLVGLASNAAAYVAYLVLAEVGGSPIVSMTCVYLVAATIGFWGNRQLTFAHRGSPFGAAGRYLLAYAVGYAINLGMLLVLVDGYGYPHPLVQAVAILVVASYLFLALTFFVFTDGTARETPTTEAGER